MLIECPECKRQISDGAANCPQCGFVVSKLGAPVAAAPSDLSIESRILIEQRVMNDGPSAGVAYLLWLFLGVFSAHRFYLGRPGTALLQIASYFILVGFLWWLLDAVLIQDMLRARRAAIRGRLAGEAMSPPSTLGAPNIYAGMSSYHDPQAAR